MTETIDFSDAIRSMISVIVLAAVQPYVQFIGRGIMTHDEAAAAMKHDADTYERMDMPAPLIGEAVAFAIRDYANKAFDKKSDSESVAKRPKLSIVTGEG